MPKKKDRTAEHALPQEWLWRLEEADGYLDLRMPVRAQELLSNMPKACQDHPLFIAIRLRLAMDQKEWALGSALGEALTRQNPDSLEGFIHWAYCVRRHVDIPSARHILAAASKRWPKEPLIFYNLACYECQMGHLVEALRLLRKAVRQQADFQTLALEDTDLQPLWPLLEEGVLTPPSPQK